MPGAHDQIISRLNLPVNRQFARIRSVNRAGPFSEVVMHLVRERRLLPIALAIAFVLSVPGSANAIAVLRLSWEGCDNIATNQLWSGPKVYTLTASATGFPANPKIGRASCRERV